LFSLFFSSHRAFSPVSYDSFFFFSSGHFCSSLTFFFWQIFVERTPIQEIEMAIIEVNLKYIIDYFSFFFCFSVTQAQQNGA
jgi:hypothetical protein